MKQSKVFGFTLIEMMLVMVIIGMMLFLGMRYMQEQTDQLRNDRTALQMQQILNAGLAFYVANGKWPQSISDLSGYLPQDLTSPWGGEYIVLSNRTPSSNVQTKPNLYVYTSISGGSATGSVPRSATLIASKLPLSYTTTEDPSTPANLPAPNDLCVASGTQGKVTSPGKCYIVASVNLPGQNLNNSTAVNFTGLYHNGDCVPKPSCPFDSVSGQNQTPSIIVSPVSVTGAFDSPTCIDPNNPSCVLATPITGFTAYALSGTSGASPNDCSGTTPTPCSTGPNDPAGQEYWRVCLSVKTSKGDISASATSDWNQLYGTVMAMTRCSPNNEPAGTPFTVFGQ